MITYIIQVHDTDHVNVLLTEILDKKNYQKAQQVSSAIG